MTTTKGRGKKTRRPAARRTRQGGSAISGKRLAPLAIAMIIDKSGSMARLSESTVAGFNEYLEVQRRDQPDALLSVTLFDTRFLPLHRNERVGNVAPLTLAKYQEDGMLETALNDAIGRTVTQMAADPLIVGRRVLVVVMTDGKENRSTEWTSEAIARLRAEKEAEGWKFVFFGQSEASMHEGRRYGMDQRRLVRSSATRSGTLAAYHGLSAATGLYAAGADEEVWSRALHGEGSILEGERATGIGDARLLERHALEEARRLRDVKRDLVPEDLGRRREDEFEELRCTCQGVMMRVIPNGEFYETTCPAHGKKRFYGTRVTC